MLEKIKSSIFLIALNFVCFVFPLLGGYWFIYGSFYVKIALILLLIYQYTICEFSPSFKRFVHWGSPIKYFNGYKLIFDDNDTQNNSQKKTLLCYHPHGVMAYGVTLLTYQEDFFHNFIRLGSRMALNTPWGGIILKLGGIQGINPENLVKLMKNEKNILMVPGGYEEATLSNFNEDRVFLKGRKGFIKYALKYGYTVHPCYGFNENKAYYYFTSVKIGLWLNKLKIPAVLFLSKYLNILPNEDIFLCTVIGKGIKMPQIDKPQKEDINHYHNLYLENLKELFEKYKNRFGGSSELKIY